MPEDQQKLEQKSPEQLQDDEKKNLKKLLEAHMAVLEHKLGRAPSVAELTQELAEVSETQQSSGTAEKMLQAVGGSQDEEIEEEPKILHYKVYYGLKSEPGENGEEMKAPDPNTILYFESPDRRVYDTRAHEWCGQRPEILDHLNSRPMMFDEKGNDIMAALLHGVLDEDDYSALEKAEMLNEHHRKIWELQKKLHSQMADLEKSEEIEEPLEEPILEEEAESISEEPEMTDDSEFVLPGEDLVQQIVATAMASPEIDRHLKRVIQEEVSRHFSEFMEMIAQMEPQPANSQEFEEYTEEPVE